MNRMPDTARILPFPPNGIAQAGVMHISPKPPAEAPSPDSEALLAAVDAFMATKGGGEGHFTTPMEGVHIMRTFQKMMPMRRIYRPSLCVVIKGAKEILFGDAQLHYGEMECLVVSVELPATGRSIGATPNDPFVGITIDLDVGMLREVMQQLATLPKPDPASGPCVFVGKVDAQLSDCVLRIARLTMTPEAVPVLYPSAMREICYWLLTGPYGGEIAKLALPDTQTERVARAIYLLRENYNRPIRVEQLADAARMSPSSFHHHFRAMTSMTPVQYQKQLRLLEARRLMVADAVNVSEAAYEVGYESASQFSREYSRAFGAAPKQDVTNLKALMAYGMR